ncbi:MAG: SPFH domain-containing protein [Candidatus Obscuribacterales bacterium]
MGIEAILLGIGAVVFLVLLASFVGSFYQKCGPNQAMIISGMGCQKGEHQFKIVKGGGDVVVPVIQQRAFLSLEVMPIDVRSQSPIITKSGVPVFVEGVAQVKIRGDDESIATAAEQFLGKSDEEIASIAHETLVGHLRAILGNLEVEELYQNFEAFAQKVQEVSIGDLRKMGLTVVSFTIKDIKDNVGYLEALGRKRTAEAKREADIGVANASRDTQIAAADADRDAQIRKAVAAQDGAKAKLQADAQVAEAQKEFQVKQAQFQAEVSQKKAASDLAYDIVKAQTQQKLVEETQKIRIIEAQKSVELQAVEVQKRQVELEAEIQKPAEAQQTQIRILAVAEQEKRKLLAQADAEAARLRAIGEAEATRARAAAEADAIKATGIAQAEAAKAKGLAEAAVIAARGDAEAIAMSKKAEAYRLYNDAAMASMIIDKLPELVAAAAAPLSKVGNMTVLSTGGEGGASKITGDVLSIAAQGLTLVKGLTGIDLTSSFKRGDNGAPTDVKVLAETPKAPSSAPPAPPKQPLA